MSGLLPAMSRAKNSPKPTMAKPQSMFGGALVNADSLRRDHMGGICKKTLRTLIEKGMPVIMLPNTQRYWFKPEACLDWIAKHQVQKNQPRAGRRS